MHDTSKDSSGTVLERFLREPLVHFLGLAAALFVMAELVGSGDTTIEITQDEIEYRIMQVEAEEGAPLTEQERRLVVEAYIDERVLVREAQEIGLDVDERIEDILVQKMLHVLSGDVIQPSEEELAVYYEGNIERYVMEPSVTVDELILPIGVPLPELIRDGGLPSELSDEEKSKLFGWMDDNSTPYLFAADMGPKGSRGPKDDKGKKHLDLRILFTLLDESQEISLKAIMVSYETKMDEVMRKAKDGTLDRDSAKAELEALEVAMQAEVEALLTDEQKQKLARPMEIRIKKRMQRIKKHIKRFLGDLNQVQDNLIEQYAKTLLTTKKNALLTVIYVKKPF